MRLIDADKIVYDKMVRPIGDGMYVDSYVVDKADIDAMPTVDAVPVIRCRDCKHSYETLPTVYRYLMCSHGVCVDCIVDEDFYCAMAERKEES